jgi:hypothetical protein
MAVDGPQWLLDHAPLLLGAGVVTWCGLYVCMLAIVRALVPSAPEAFPYTPASKKPNTAQGFAFLTISTLHCTLVAVLSWIVLSDQLFLDVVVGGGDAAGEEEVISSASASTPSFDGGWALQAAQLRIGAIGRRSTAGNLLACAGGVYLSWVLFEVVFFSWHWKTFGKVLDMLHHVLFAVTGLFCMQQFVICGYYAAVLMGMEASTPWLNVHLAFRASPSSHLRFIGQVTQ